MVKLIRKFRGFLKNYSITFLWNSMFRTWENETTNWDGSPK